MVQGSRDDTGEWEWCSGENACLSPLWPEYDSQTWRHVWAEFVVDSSPCSKGFSAGPSSFLTAQKWTFPIHI